MTPEIEGHITNELYIFRARACYFGGTLEDFQGKFLLTLHLTPWKIFTHIPVTKIYLSFVEDEKKLPKILFFNLTITSYLFEMIVLLEISVSSPMENSFF